MTVLLDVIHALVGNSKLLGFPFQTTVNNHETRVVMESRAPKWRAGRRNGEQSPEMESRALKLTPQVVFLCNAGNKYLAFQRRVE